MNDSWLSQLPVIRMVQTPEGDDGQQRVPSLFGRNVDIPASGSSWAPEENEYLLQYRRERYSWKQISQKLGGHRTDSACKSQHRRLLQITPRTDRSVRDVEGRSERSRSSSPNTRPNPSQDPIEAGQDDTVMFDEGSSELSDRPESRFRHRSPSPLVTRWDRRISELTRRRGDIDDLKRRLKIAQKKKIQAENEYNSILQDLEQHQGEQRAAMDKSIALLTQLAGFHPNRDPS